MTKTLLLALVALTMNVSGQNNRPLHVIQHQNPVYPDNIQNDPEDHHLKTRVHCPDMKWEQAGNQKVSQPKSIVMLYDSIYQWQWDTLAIGWQVTTKTIDIVYNDKNGMTSAIDQNWDGSAWVNANYRTYTFDIQNNRTNSLTQVWDGGGWVNSSQATYAYDAGNNVTGSIRQTWDGSAWVNYRKFTYTYDANNNLTSYRRENWAGGAWVNYVLYSWNFDVSNNLISDLWQNWDGSAWVNSSQELYNYNATNNLISDLSQNWEGGVWVDVSREFYTYNANNYQETRLQQGWIGGAWVDSYKTTYGYDVNDNMIHEISQYWSGSTWEDSYQVFNTYDASRNLLTGLYQNRVINAWVNTIQTINSYDANNFTKGEAYKYWNAAGTLFEYGDSTYYYFHTIVGINDLMPENGDIAVFPNPCHGTFTIGSESALGLLEVLNVNGERIHADFTFSQQVSIDLSAYGEGIYLLKVGNGAKIHTRKIIVQ